jgi:uncharacterized damage-inducible protein DinB
MDQKTLREVIRISERHFLLEGMKRVEVCLRQLSEDQVWYQPNQSSNSVGIILTHLVGNINQYVISGLGKTPDTRDRDREFHNPPRLSKAELSQKLSATLEEAVSVLKGLHPQDIQGQYYLQGFSLSFLDVVVHVIEHFSYHIGQIAYITKVLTDQQTDFYGGIDLNRLNQPQ